MDRSQQPLLDGVLPLARLHDWFHVPCLPLIPDTNRVLVSKKLLKLVTLGLLDVSGFFAWYMGLRVGLVSMVSPIALSSPAVTVVIAHIFLKERVRPHQRLSIIAVIAGIALLSPIS